VPKLPLDVCDDLPGMGLVLASIQLLGGQAKLDDEIAGQVLRFDFPSFFSPTAKEGSLVAPHDDPGVRAANEVATIRGFCLPSHEDPRAIVSPTGRRAPVQLRSGPEGRALI